MTTNPHRITDRTAADLTQGNTNTDLAISIAIHQVITAATDWQSTGWAPDMHVALDEALNELTTLWRRHTTTP